MPDRTYRRKLVRLLFVLAASITLGAAGATVASAAPVPAAGVSWQQATNILILPPPHDPSRGFCSHTPIGSKIRMSCQIKKDDTTLWVACSGGFVEIRHLPVGPVVAEGTCPQYGGYALTATSA